MNHKPKHISYFGDNAFYLSLFRVLLVLLTLKPVVLYLPHWADFFGPERKIQTHDLFFLEWIGWTQENWLPHSYWIFFLTLIFGIMSLVGIGKRWALAGLFVFSFVFLKSLSVISNGGDYFLLTCLAFLIPADSFRYFSFSKLENKWIEDRTQKLLNQLSVLSVQMLLVWVIFTNGFYKLFDPVWQRGEAVYYAFNLLSYQGLPLNIQLAQHDWVTKFLTYGSLVFEITFPLIFLKKLRVFYTLSGIMFHLGLAAFLMIYDFHLGFLLAYGFFYSHEEWVKILGARFKFVGHVQ